MAVPPVVDPLTNLQNESSAVTKINQNAQRASDAIARALSTSDTTQNTMNVPLDMNSQRILNLPTPTSSGDPIRYQDRELLRGPQGVPGVNGSNGATGATGAIGPIGLTGPIGPIGPVGPQGPGGAGSAVAGITSGTIDGASIGRTNPSSISNSGTVTIKGATPTDGSVIYGTPANNGPVTGEKFAGSPYQFYSVGGYKPGPHCYAQNIVAMKTERDHTSQEQAFAVQMLNSTGKPPTAADAASINNGKSAITVATRVEAGGGNSWGAAIAQDIGPNVGTGFFATIEVDTNNFNATSDVGSGPQIGGIYFNTYSTHTKLAVLWMSGFEPTAESPRSEKYWQYGVLMQSSNLIAKDAFGVFTGTTNVLHSGLVSHSNAFIYDESSGPYGYLCTGTRSAATLSLQDNSPVGLDVAGIKSAVGIRARDNAPTGLSIQGARSVAAIDVSQAVTGVALNLNEGQSISFGSSYDVYVANARMYWRRKSDGVNIMSLDVNGTIRALGDILQRTTP